MLYAKQFFKNDNFKNIIFSWVLADYEVHQRILSNLRNYEFNFYNISLVCDEKTVYERMLRREMTNYPDLDKQALKSQIESLFSQAKKAIGKYQNLDTLKLDVSRLSKSQVVNEILRLVK